MPLYIEQVRLAEMAKTQADAEKQTAAVNEGKHHIGDFLPPEELNKFMNKYKVFLLIEFVQTSIEIYI